MLAPLTQLVLLVTFAIIGILVGVGQLNDARSCRYCGLDLTSGVTRCPRCLCKLD